MEREPNSLPSFHLTSGKDSGSRFKLWSQDRGKGSSGDSPGVKGSGDSPRFSVADERKRGSKLDAAFAFRNSKNSKGFENDPEDYMKDASPVAWRGRAVW